jgi:hypothetical protein
MASEYRVVGFSASKDLFLSLPWAQVLEVGFHAETCLLEIDQSGYQYAVTIFRKAVFAIAYIDFPLVQRGEKPEPVLHRVADALAAAGKKVDAIRMTSHSEPADQSALLAKQCHTAIKQIDTRAIFSMSKVKKSLNPAKKFDIRIVENMEPEWPKKMFGLYQETIRLRQGSMRYTPGYFQAVTELAQDNDDFYVLTALVEGEYAGCLVLALAQDTAYYLHCFYDRAFNKYRVSDKLLEKALIIAEARGMKRFDMGESPPDNEGLIVFKEKWGGETKPSYGIQYDVVPFKCLLMRQLSWLATILFRFLPGGQGKT